MREKLRAARKQLNYRQVEVANELDMTARHYRHIEAGTRGTSETKWLKLYHLFKCEIPLNELMEVTDLFPMQET